MGDVSARTPSENAERLLNAITRMVREPIGGGVRRQCKDGEAVMCLCNAVTKLAERLNDVSLIVAQLVAVVTLGMRQTLAKIVSHTFEVPETLNLDREVNMRANAMGSAALGWTHSMRKDT